MFVKIFGYLHTQDTFIYNLALYKINPRLFLLFSPLVDSSLVLILSRPVAHVGTLRLGSGPLVRASSSPPLTLPQAGSVLGASGLAPLCLSACLSLLHTHSYTQFRITTYNTQQPFWGKVTIWNHEGELPLMKEEDFLMNLCVLSLAAYWGLSKVSYSEWVFESRP